jgi:hypothetical protein
MAVTPVRIGPTPEMSSPSPFMRVEWPTRIPLTSVMALYFPGLYFPKLIPRSLRRHLPLAAFAEGP